VNAAREQNGDDLSAEHFPPEIRTAEARTLYRSLSHLSTGLAAHVTRADQRYTRFEERIETKLDAFLGGIRLEIWSLKGNKPPSVPPLPPMRPESPSSAIILEQANIKVVEKLQEMAPKTPGPATHVEAKPEEIAKAVRDVVADVFQEREHASNAKILRLQRKVAVAAAFAFVTSLFGAAGLWTWGKAQGHAEAAVESRTRAPAAASHSP